MHGAPVLAPGVTSSAWHILPAGTGSDTGLWSPSNPTNQVEADGASTAGLADEMTRMNMAGSTTPPLLASA